MSTPDQMLAEAKALYASRPERALELRRRVANGEMGAAWVEANADLALHELGTGDYAAAIEHAKKVLDAPAGLGPQSAAAVAGVILCNAREALDLDVDKQALAESAENAISTGQPYFAGIAFDQLARRSAASGDRADAIRLMLRAAELYDESGSMTAGPGALARVAQMEIEDAEPEQAAAHIETALARLASFPLGGTSVRLLEGKLRVLQQSLQK